MDLLSYYRFRPKYAYFSMEIALQPSIHTYSGGLGILAGDSLRSAADLELPMVFVTLISRSGYLSQKITSDGKQINAPDRWHPDDWAIPLRVKIAITIQGHDVWINPWLYIYQGVTGYSVPVLLLDTSLKENSAEDQKITDHLYGGDETYRLKQEMVLGIGGVRILRALGFGISAYHLNEGHSALLALELLRNYQIHNNPTHKQCMYDIAKVQDLCVFTTHTPIEAAHDNYSFDIFQNIASDYIDTETLKTITGGDSLNMTCLALNLSGRINGVSNQHQKIAKQKYPSFKVESITNGVHPATWVNRYMADLYTKYFAEWQHEPSVLIRADQIPNDEIWQAHLNAKSDLHDHIKTSHSIKLGLDVFTIGFARRMTGYKRPDLLFNNIQRLAEISRKFPIQVVLAGKAHPKDQHGLQLIQQLHQYMLELSDSITIVYLEDYNMQLAQKLIPGVDLWLNTPKPLMEASGTSGIKAAFNGVPHMSVLDGWWTEGHIEGVTGWSIEHFTTDEQDADGLYYKLEKDCTAHILPGQGELAKYNESSHQQEHAL